MFLLLLFVLQVATFHVAPGSASGAKAIEKTLTRGVGLRVEIIDQNNK